MMEDPNSRRRSMLLDEQDENDRPSNYRKRPSRDFGEYPSSHSPSRRRSSSARRKIGDLTVESTGSLNKHRSRSPSSRSPGLSDRRSLQSSLRSPASPRLNGSGSTRHQGELLQVIDDEKRFNPDLNSYIHHSGLVDSGFDYNVVAVFGAQSTGKSTLLNKIFDTGFDVMSSKVRRQTTKGIWIGTSSEGRTIVLDVEGTDGRERGEDQDFERKSALFSLTVAECIIINMWESAVGLYHGANLHLFKTVVEVNLQLFQGSRDSPKTQLMFVIRDFSGATPLDNLAATLRQDLDGVWGELKKPDGWEGSVLEDHFDLEFYGLPHKVFQPDMFEEECMRLRRRFTDPGHPDYAFRSTYKKGVPADGFARYAEDIWAQVLANRDLDLPSQQELLAQFRCDEIASEAFSKFRKQTAKFNGAIERGAVIPEIVEDCLELKQDGLAAFDAKASRYHEGVYKKKRSELVGIFDAALHTLFSDHLRNIRAKLVRELQEKLEDVSWKSRSPPLAQRLRALYKGVTGYFKEKTDQAASVREDQDPDATDAYLDFNDTYDQTADTFEKLITAKRKSELEAFDADFVERMRRTVLVHTERDIEEADWAKVVERIDTLVSKAWDEYEQVLTEGFDKTPQLIDLQKLAAHSFSRHVMKDTVMDDEWVVKRMVKLFERKFKYDSEGLPRVWAPDDDVTREFKAASIHGESLLSQYEFINFVKPRSPQRAASTSLDSPRRPGALSSKDHKRLLRDYDTMSSAPDLETAGLKRPSVVATAINQETQSLNTMSEERRENLVKLFKDATEPLFLEAKRHVVMARTAYTAAERAASSATHIAGTFVLGSLRIPYWALAIVVVLGWNEFIAILSNPLLFFTTLIVCVSVYAIYFTAPGQIIRVPLEAAMGAGLRSATGSLRPPSNYPEDQRGEEMEMRPVRS